MVDFQITLEQAAFDGKQVSIKTKNRGTISGMFTGIDEFETDPYRLGLCVDISEYEYDVVFPDEIIEITILSESKEVFGKGSRSCSSMNSAKSATNFTSN